METKHDDNGKSKGDAITEIKHMFLDGVRAKIQDSLSDELDKMFLGIAMAMKEIVEECEHSDTSGVFPVADEHLRRSFKAYLHAREKHPYFADSVGWFDQDGKDGQYSEANHLQARKYLSYKRRSIKQGAERGRVRATNVLECEIAEIEEAIASKDFRSAVDECYDAIAVLMRMVDVLEGRQALGDPAKQDEKKEGDEE